MLSRPDDEPAIRVTAVLASPRASGSTATAVHALLEGCSDLGAETEVVHLDGAAAYDEALTSLAQADAVVLASPTYRSTHTSVLAGFLEQVGRDPSAGDPSLTGKVAAVVMTGASAEHFLAPTALLQVLACFFGCQVLCPPLYLDRTAFDEPSDLAPRPADRLREQGRALVELAAACRAGEHLGVLRPLI